MEQVYVMVFGRIVAHQAEIEAMKIQNEIDRLHNQNPNAEQIPFTYGPDDFFNKAQEIYSTTNELFR